MGLHEFMTSIYLKKAWFSTQIFHMRLACLLDINLNPIKLWNSSNCKQKCFMIRNPFKVINKQDITIVPELAFTGLSHKNLKLFLPPLFVT